MKLLHVILLALGIVLGIVIHKFVLSSSPVLAETEDPVSVPVEEVQQMVDNFMEYNDGQEKYYYLSDELLTQLVYVKSTVNSGRGFVVRLGSQEPGTPYDVAIYSRFEDDLNEIEDYFQAPMSKADSDMCPHMCDVSSPISYP